ncbi:hypothetical protein GCM10010919_33650 [Alishewanella longhuensis]|uniref:Uncharacterized protein n=1 Tax=Alishewanella longhuensis TaxID=1091037 RepID=A0ABQ3L3I0_9ALTE|nr:hypothetical protein [Alishewanella longhuensis]GHG77767.1 hypothetical protein GCM10010919_33650 [Alishewanella longhuensis]
MMMKKQLLMVLAIMGALALVSPVALSHSDAKPQHGGVLHSKYDLNFELVREADSISLYVDDHGEPVDTTALTGQIMILAGGERSEAALVAAGAGKLIATGVHIPDGARVVVSLTDADNKVMTVRYIF